MLYKSNKRSDDNAGLGKTCHSNLIFSQDVKLKFELKLQEDEFIELSKFTDINKVEANHLFTIYLFLISHLIKY